MFVYVVELWKPGVWLQGLSTGEARAAESLLGLLELSLTDAALSLSLFNQAHAAAYSTLAEPPFLQDWEHDRSVRAELRSKLLQDLPPDLAPQARWNAERRIDEQVEIEFKRQRWSAGHVPRSYTNRMPFLHAKTFLYALDTMHKTLEQLSHIAGVPAQVATELAQFYKAFPSLKEVRNSAHHVEDRVQGKARSKRIVLKPVQNSAISAPGGGVLVVDMLNNNRYGGTVADGSYAEVDVTEASLVEVGRLVQRIFDAFTWTGPSSHSPS